MCRLFNRAWLARLWFEGGVSTVDDVDLGTNAFVFLPVSVDDSVLCRYESIDVEWVKVEMSSVDVSDKTTIDRFCRVQVLEVMSWCTRRVTAKRVTSNEDAVGAI